MKLFLIEAAVLCVLFTAVVVPSDLKDPLKWVGDYPPAIGARCRELGLIGEQKKPSLGTILVTKLGRLLVSVGIFTAVAVGINGAKTFWQGVGLAYGLWTVVAWYDALILDCLWFCHSKKVRIPGTEDLDDAYRDYGFHLRMSCLGMVLGLPVALAVGGLTALLA